MGKNFLIGVFARKNAVNSLKTKFFPNLTWDFKSLGKRLSEF
jgi:hypothetical protein